MEEEREEREEGNDEKKVGGGVARKKRRLRAEREVDMAAPAERHDEMEDDEDRIVRLAQELLDDDEKDNTPVAEVAVDALRPQDFIRIRARNMAPEAKAALRARYVQGDETLVVTSKDVAAVAIARDATAVARVLKARRAVPHPITKKSHLVYTFRYLREADAALQMQLESKGKGGQSSTAAERVGRGDKKSASWLANKSQRERARRGAADQCQVCQTRLGDKKHTVCPNDHYYCEDCVNGLVVNATDPGNIGRFKEHEKNVYCLACSHPFSIPELCHANASPSSIERIVRLREDIAEARGQAFAGGAEPDALYNRDLQSKVERLFLITCPTCDKPISDDFADHECAALVCDAGHAPTSFCGICGMDCSNGGGAPDGANDAHWHVRHCKYNMNPFEGVGAVQVKNMFVDRGTLKKGREMLYGDRLVQLMITERVSKQTLQDVASTVLDVAGFDLNAL